jgi:glycosyltransferase involved in cell wall biosynthesis
LRQLLDDPALRRQLGCEGRRAVNQQFTTERMAAKVGTIYDQLMTPAPVRRSLNPQIP